MNNSRAKSLADHFILGLSILLVFTLIFDRYVTIPPALSSFGRFHPVIIHFPIVLILLVIVNSFTRQKPYQEILLPLTAIFSLFTALTGYLLYKQTGSESDLISRHQWLGSGAALCMAGWYASGYIRISFSKVSAFLRVSLVLLIVSAGHYGGMITHGKDYLTLFTSPGGNETGIPDDPVIYQHIIGPLFETRCLSCHNEDKSKGELILSDYESLMHGGESHTTVIAGNPGESELIRRISLPEGDEHHMPPAGKAQLSVLEISIIEGWIKNGASENRKLSEMEPSDSFSIAVRGYAEASRDPYRDLQEISGSVLSGLSDDYCTISRLFAHSNAISVVLFPDPDYTHDRLSALKQVRQNIIELDLSSLPLGREEAEFIAGCSSLERLSIDFTPVNDTLFSKFGELNKLKVLKAQGTHLTDNSLENILGLPAIEKLFVWKTGISEDGIRKLRSSGKNVLVNNGLDPSIHFDATLPVPEIEPNFVFFRDPFDLRFDHPLKDIDIYFSQNGEDPGPETGLFSKRLNIDHTSSLKFMASKAGWKNSLVDSVRFFHTLRGPDSWELHALPDPKYAGRGKNSLFDLKKGTFDVGDSSWIGYRENVFELSCTWNDPIDLSSVTLSSLINTGIHIFPPSSIIITGKSVKQEQKLLATLSPGIPDSQQGSAFNFMTLPVSGKSIISLTITVRPLTKLPSWHDAKGEPGWFFIDEVVLEN